jgi:predicted nucleic acid-binding protein
VTVPLADLLIFACAKIHGLEVAHDDTHFDELSKLEA